MDTHNCYLQLEQILTGELEHAGELLVLLQQEKDLIHGEPESLARLVAQKEKIIKTLQSLNRDQQALVQHYGFDTTREGTENCLQWCDIKQQLSTHWQKLLVTLQQCQQANSVNGIIIDDAQHTTRQTLTLLYGQSQQSTAYGASGKKVEDELSRSIGKA